MDTHSCLIEFIKGNGEFQVTEKELEVLFLLSSHQIKSLGSATPMYSAQNGWWESRVLLAVVCKPVSPRTRDFLWKYF